MYQPTPHSVGGRPALLSRQSVLSDTNSMASATSNTTNHFGFNHTAYSPPTPNFGPSPIPQIYPLSPYSPTPILPHSRHSFAASDTQSVSSHGRPASQVNSPTQVFSPNTNFANYYNTGPSPALTPLPATGTNTSSSFNDAEMQTYTLPRQPHVPMGPADYSTLEVTPSAAPLTLFLQHSHPQLLSVATQHAFLRLAGLGQLPKPTLSRWLAQDRLYAQAYVSFVGALIARVSLPHPSVPAALKSQSLRWRILTALNSCLANILRELAFFDTVAERYGLDLDFPNLPAGVFAPEPATRQYIELFGAFGSDTSMSLLEGLVVLWATESVYLTAWRYAASFASTTDSKPEGDLDSGALRKEFIPNWTGAEFSDFVREIGDCLDMLCEREDPKGKRREVFAAVWKYVLDIERRFWPDV